MNGRLASPWASQTIEPDATPLMYKRGARDA